MHGDGVPPPPAPEKAPAPAPEPCWTRQQDKLLELLLCHMYPRWDRIATHLGSKTPDQVCQRYERMVAELRRVLEAPEVETPPEWDLHGATPALLHGQVTIAVDDRALAAGGESAVPEDAGAAPAVPAAAAVGEEVGTPACRTRGKTSEETDNKRKRGGHRKKVFNQQIGRNKAVPWSVEEHHLFLAGIKKYGKGMWKRLSWEFVRTRSPTQIASHYQKYALRQAKLDRNECKRPSIHDINDAATVPVDTGGRQSAPADHDDEQPPVAAGQAKLGTTYESAGADEVVTIDELSAAEDELAALVPSRQDQR